MPRPRRQVPRFGPGQVKVEQQGRQDEGRQAQQAAPIAPQRRALVPPHIAQQGGRPERHRAVVRQAQAVNQGQQVERPRRARLPPAQRERHDQGDHQRVKSILVGQQGLLPKGQTQRQAQRCHQRGHGPPEGQVHAVIDQDCRQGSGCGGEQVHPPGDRRAEGQHAPHLAQQDVQRRAGRMRHAQDGWDKLQLARIATHDARGQGEHIDHQERRQQDDPGPAIAFGEKGPDTLQISPTLCTQAQTCCSRSSITAKICAVNC